MLKKRPDLTQKMEKVVFLRQVRSIVSSFFIIVLFATSLAAVQPHYAYAKIPVCTKCFAGPEVAVDAAGHAAHEEVHWAKKLLDWLKMFEYLDMAIGFLTDILGVFEKVRDLVAEKLDVETAVKFIDDSLNTLAKATMHQDKKNTIIESKNNEVTSNIVAQHTGGDSGESAYCNNVTARKGPAIVFPFSIFIENTITAANEALFLGAGADGDGPYYAAFAHLLSCPSKDSQDPRRSDPRTGLKQMEYPQDCMDSEEMFDGADITARIVSGEIVELMMPPFVNHEIKLSDGSTRTVKVPKVDDSLLSPQCDPVTDPNCEKGAIDSDNPKLDIVAREAHTAQKAFMAAWKYCVRAMGSRVTPPSGDAITTHQGLTTVASWHHCAGVQSNFIRSCARMLAKHTKPNCSYKDEETGVTFDQLCNESALACDAASVLDTNLPFNCRLPMSLYQSEYASHMACFGRHKLLGEVNGVGANNRKGRNICQVGYDLWQAQLAKEKSAFVKAQRELVEMRECWPNNNISPAVQ